MQCYRYAVHVARLCPNKTEWFFLSRIHVLINIPPEFRQYPCDVNRVCDNHQPHTQQATTPIISRWLVDREVSVRLVHSLAALLPEMLSVNEFHF